MKGQTLPWVAINIVGMIVLIVILISILTLQKNISMGAKEIDKRTATLMMLREFITSPNCVAYEEGTYHYYNGSKLRLIYSDVVHPGIIDVYKYRDFYHFNCLRYDSKNDRNEITYAYQARLWDVNARKWVDSFVKIGYGHSGPIYYPPNKTTHSYEYGGFFPNSNDTMGMIEPVLIRNGSTLHLGVLYFRVVLDKSNKFSQVNIWEGSLS